MITETKIVCAQGSRQRLRPKNRIHAENILDSGDGVGGSEDIERVEKLLVDQNIAGLIVEKYQHDKVSFLYLEETEMPSQLQDDEVYMAAEELHQKELQTLDLCEKETSRFAELSALRAEMLTKRLRV